MLSLGVSGMTQPPSQGGLGTQENSNKYLPLGCMKQTMKCFTAVARREGAQVRKGRVGIADLLKATGRGLASIH